MRKPVVWLHQMHVKKRRSVVVLASWIGVSIDEIKSALASGFVPHDWWDRLIQGRARQERLDLMKRVIRDRKHKRTKSTVE